MKLLILFLKLCRLNIRTFSIIRNVMRLTLQNKMNKQTDRQYEFLLLLQFLNSFCEQNKTNLCKFLVVCWMPFHSKVLCPRHTCPLCCTCHHTVARTCSNNHIRQKFVGRHLGSQAVWVDSYIAWDIR